MTRFERIEPATSIAKDSRGVLVHDGQTFQLLTVGAGIEYEVVCPYLIDRFGRGRSQSTSRNPAPWPLARPSNTPEHTKMVIFSVE